MIKHKRRHIQLCAPFQLIRPVLCWVLQSLDSKAKVIKRTDLITQRDLAKILKSFMKCGLTTFHGIKESCKGSAVHLGTKTKTAGLQRGKPEPKSNNILDVLVLSAALVKYMRRGNRGEKKIMQLQPGSKRFLKYVIHILSSWTVTGTTKSPVCI